MDSVRAFSEELESFAADLRRLRLDRGNRSYRELTARAAKSKTGIRLPVSTQSDAFRGDGLPRLDSLMGLVRILLSYDEFGQERPVPPHNSPELEHWRRRWRDLAALAPLRRSPAPAAVVTQERAPVPAYRSRFTLAHVLTTRADNNWCAAFSPDGRLLAVSGSHEDEAVVQLWDPVRGVAVGELADRPLAFSLAFSPGGHLLAVGDCEGAVTLWDTATFARVGAPLLGHGRSVDVVVFAADGRTLVTADDEIVHRWDITTGEPAESPLFGEIEAMFCRPDGSILAALRTKHTLRLWDLASAASAGRPLIDNIDGPVEATFSPDGALLATTYDHETLLWSTSTSTLARRLPEAADSGATMAFSRDSRLLATTSDHGTVRLWDPSTGALLGPPLAEYKGPFDRLAMSPDGRMLALCGEADTLVVYRAKPDEEPPTPLPLAARALDSALRKHRAVALPPLASETGVALRRLAFSPDGSRLRVRTEDGLILTWDPAARVRLPETLASPSGPDLSADGVPARSGLAAAIGERAARWDPAAPESGGLELEAHLSSAGAVAFSPDGRLLATGDAGGHIVLWDMSTPEGPGRHLSGHTGAVCDLAFSPQGHRLASAGSDGTVQLWDTATGEAATDLPLTGHTGAVRGVAFAPDASLLASAGDDGTLRCWLLPAPHTPTARPR
ncbi:WD40 repeat protein [Streptomyces sp. 3211.6]|uniref:WD40 repeat domain-containing protein n=1 Tax=Streptomyces TaxID=1883 RepID=UPI0009A49545|nr:MULTISPECIES: WD40 repeat domain-containing protein [Streptomyces]RKT03229.1 WD40 repeat protein [Streptomyces sp. 3211.6]RPF29350.1 WD40 repeat protein [Streptomyces sp. Ag109_G2-6]